MLMKSKIIFLIKIKFKLIINDTYQYDRTI